MDVITKINTYLSEKWVKTNKLPTEDEIILNHVNFNQILGNNKVNVKFSKNSKLVQFDIYRNNFKEGHTKKSYVYKLAGVSNLIVTEDITKIINLPNEVNKLLRTQTYRSNVGGNKITIKLSKNGRSIKVKIDNPKTIENTKTFIFNLVGVDQKKRNRLSNIEKDNEKDLASYLKGRLK